MNDTDPQRVSCPGCGKGYRWDTQLVGRAVECRKCGARFEVPDAPGLPGIRLDTPVTDDGTYELDLGEDERHPDAPEPVAVPANDGKCPACNSKISDRAVICLNCGFNLRQGERIQTSVVNAPDEPDDTEPTDTGRPAGPGPLMAAPAVGTAALSARRRVDQDEIAAETARHHQFMDYKLPAILLAVGAVIALVNILVLAPAAPSMAGPGQGAFSRMEVMIYEAINSAGSFVLNAALLFVGLIILVQLFGAAFGEVFSVILKIAAIVLLVGEVLAAIFFAFDIATGGFGYLAILFNWFIYLGLMCAMCIKLLDLDITELRVLIVFIIVGRIATEYGLAALLMMIF
jgi:hypothetical protein